MRLFRPLSPLEEDRRIRAEFVNDLPAGAARRARHSLVVDHRNRADLDPGSKLRHGRENRRTFGAISHSIGRILHITTREDFPIRKQDGRSDPELRVGRMRVPHHFLRRSRESCPDVGPHRLLAHRGKVSRETAKSRAIVNPRQTIHLFFLPGWIRATDHRKGVSRCKLAL